MTTPSGQRFDYLHGALDTIVVALGQQVEAAQPLVKVSNNMGDTPTSIHLHFNIKQDVGGVGFVYVSPYMSLVAAYKELMGKLPNDARTRLKQTQIAWIDQRNGSCSRKIDSGFFVNLSCATRTTRERLEAGGRA